MPEHQPGGLVLQMEQVELLAELAVIALLGFLEPVQVGVLVLLLRPGRAVDPLQHLVARIAPPVRSGELHQLEDLEFAGRRHVRAAAQVDERAFTVQADRFAVGDRRDDLGLVALPDRLEEAHRLVAIPLLADDGFVLLREFGHLRLDRGEVLGGERTLVREVVEETVLDDRPDRDLGVGEEILHRVGEQVRRRMTDHIEPVGVLVGHDRERGVVVDAMRGVDEGAVDPAGQCGLGEAGADRGGHVGHGRRRREFANRTVGQADFRHVRVLWVGGLCGESGAGRRGPARCKKKVRSSRTFLG